MSTWSTEHSLETSLGSVAIWATWADVTRWGEWNPDIEHVELDGPFAAGSTIVMTPIGQEPVRLRIVEALAGERFVDEAEIAGTVLRTLHLIEPLAGGRARVTYRMEAEGPAAAEIGPAVSADFPQTLAGLLDHTAARDGAHAV